MAFSLWNSWLVIGILESLVGIALNSGIVVASKATVRNKLLTNPTTLLNLMIGLVNLLLLGMISIEVILSMACQPSLFNIEVVSFFQVTVVWSQYFSYWLMAWLCLCYLAIVANFTHRLFLWLKKAFSSLLPYLLVLSAVGSFGGSLLTLWDVPLLDATNDSTTDVIPNYFRSAYQILSMFLGCWLPVLLTSISIGFTLVSILRHIWRIKKNGAGFKGPHLQAHINAIRTMVLLFLLGFGSYLVTCFDLLNTYISMEMYVIDWMLVTSFPTLEAVILILASSKMKKMFQMNCLRRDGNHH